MAKIHLLIKKEDIDLEKVNEGNKIAVVLDVLLATTTITSALNDGAKEVIPVMDENEAKKVFQEYTSESCILAGEFKAKPINGFVYPSPRIIRQSIDGKRLILSTTNGTVALRKASGAKKVFVASLLNNPAVAQRVREDGLADTVLVICSGTSGELSLEDFYGAGHFISCLLEDDDGTTELTDAASAAFLFYKGSEDKSFEILRSSHVGQLFEKNSIEEELSFAAQKGAIPIVPVLKNGKIIVEKFVDTLS